MAQSSLRTAVARRDTFSATGDEKVGEEIMQKIMRSIIQASLLFVPILIFSAQLDVAQAQDGSKRSRAAVA